MVRKVGKPCFPMLVLCGMSVGDTGVVSEILYSLQDGQGASSCVSVRTRVRVCGGAPGPHRGWPCSGGWQPGPSSSTCASPPPSCRCGPGSGPTGIPCARSRSSCSPPSQSTCSGTGCAAQSSSSRQELSGGRNGPMGDLSAGTPLSSCLPRGNLRLGPRGVGGTVSNA